MIRMELDRERKTSAMKIAGGLVRFLFCGTKAKTAEVNLDGCESNPEDT